MSERDDAKATNAARPRDYEFSDSERDASYLDTLAGCPECDLGYLVDDISVSGEPRRRICPKCGYWEYEDAGGESV